MARHCRTIGIRHVMAAVAAGLGWLSAGCAVDPAVSDPRQMHPLVVEQRVVELELATDLGQLSLADDARFDRFLDGYGATAAGPLRVVGSLDAAVHRDVIAARLVQHGLRPSEVQWHAPAASERRNETMRLSYMRADVRLPRCGDWSTPTGFNPLNLLYPNFGCTVRRNLGIAIAQPADLVRMRRPDPRDTTRSDLAIQQYRAGESTVSDIGGSEFSIESLTDN